jgi:hypothetical protein
MKPVKFFLTGFIFLNLLSCNSPATNENETTAGQDTAQHITETTLNYTAEEKEAVVNTGGPTSEEQLVLEEQLAELTTNLESSKGTPFEKILGHWVGAFGKNKINITITAINEADKSVQGYSVCAGNFRRLSGNYSLNNNLYTFQLNEPGDDPYDGKFDFTIAAGSQEMNGNWTPFEQEGNSSKKYTLEKRTYEYDETSGRFEASSRLLEVSDVENQALEDLRLMRNEIYARHGYCFKDKDMRYHFEQEDWYMPMGVDIRHELTDIEIANITLIYEYEDYYMEYSDDFGR